MRSSASRSACAGVVRLAGISTLPYEARTEKPSPSAESAARAAADQRWPRAGSHARGPRRTRRPRAGTRRRRRRSPTAAVFPGAPASCRRRGGQSGRCTLEAVEVEDHEHGGRPSPLRRELRCSSIVPQRSPVPEAGQRVRHRLMSGGLSSWTFSRKRPGRPSDQEQHRARRRAPARRRRRDESRRIPARERQDRKYPRDDEQPPTLELQPSQDSRLHGCQAATPVTSTPRPSTASRVIPPTV